MNDSNKKIVFVLEKAYAENEDMNIQTIEAATVGVL